MEDNNSFVRAMSILKVNGVPNYDRYVIRDAFADWGRTFNPDIEEDRRHGECYRNKNIEGYGFNTHNEAELVGLLKKIKPQAEARQLVSVLSIINKLPDVPSTYLF